MVFLSVKSDKKSQRLIRIVECNFCKNTQIFLRFVMVHNQKSNRFFRRKIPKMQFIFGFLQNYQSFFKSLSKQVPLTWDWNSEMHQWILKVHFSTSSRNRFQCGSVQRSPWLIIMHIGDYNLHHSYATRKFFVEKSNFERG